MDSNVPGVERDTAEKEKLLKELLSAVKECQRQFGGRLQLATEIDPNVARLCNALEAILSHGLKTVPVNALTKAAQKLEPSLEQPTFYSCVKKVLSKHERERYVLLKKVKNNFGRGRAWLRSALNERSLERYVQCLLCYGYLDEFYEQHAFLRDEERSYILPTVAAGLVPILFAISIDRRELNKSNRKQAFLSEPVISISNDLAVIKTKSSANKNFVNHVIDFGKDMDVDEDIIDESNDSKGESPTDGIEIGLDVSEALSDELSNLCGDRRSETENTNSAALRPICHEEVGLLIPVNNPGGTAANSDYRSENGSFTSTDEGLLNVLTECKEGLKNQAENNEKLGARIEELTRENEVLKHQLRKYVGAVQLLKQEDADHSLEAQMYEQKLIQVAEMHGELFELNRRLQASLFSKEDMVKHLQEELIAIRGPLPATQDFSLHTLVSLWIPSAFLTGSKTSPYHVYQVHIRIGSDEWTIYRRYSQFHSFHKNFKKEFVLTETFYFPPKKTIGNKDTTFVEDRRKRLQLYLRQVINFLLARDPQLAFNPSKSLFISRVSFFGEEYKSENISPSFKSCPTNEQVIEDNSQYSGL